MLGMLGMERLPGVDVAIFVCKIPSKKKLRSMLITKKVEANGCSPKQFSLFKGKHHIRTYQVR